MNGHALRRASIVLAALAAALVAPSAARAQKGGRGGGVTCAFGVANALAFGTYDPLAAAPSDSSATMSYRCPPGQPLRISLDAGLAGTFDARALTMGSERLEYNLYLDAARTIVWGDGTGGSRVGPGVTTHGAGGTVTAYVFGRIRAGQDVAAGVYGDTITVDFQL